MMNVDITGVRAHIAVHFGLEGSVLAGTIQASAPKVETNYQIESPTTPNALRRSCATPATAAGCVPPSPTPHPSRTNQPSTANRFTSIDLPLH